MWNKISNAERVELSDLSLVMGKIANYDLYKDGLRIAKQYKSMDTLKSLDPRKWLSDTNCTIRGFLEGATGVNSTHHNPKKVRSLVHALEQTYYTCDLDVITPFAFRWNMVLYNLTHSKAALTLMGDWESSGSYSTITDIVTAPSPALTCDIDSDVINAIDNNQKIGRCGRRIKE